MSQKITGYQGREITPEEVKAEKYLDIVYKFEPKYSWAAGVAISRFLIELKDGKIFARKCHKCERILVPPRMYCEQCYRPTDEWVQVKDTGTVNTFSISHVGTDARRLRTPIPVAVVDIDGASPGMGILHNLGEVDHSEISIGMKVQAVWKQLEERQGAITDIRYFKPVES
ncbi:MAG TPA: Zn-ribbon domain-containing OB-fold protein [Candidatus Angelobacter sp.]|nr:Zn-ribbon domain-containing OB-fold protein [Candidatus Angelobacter sp.]